MKKEFISCIILLLMAGCANQLYDLSQEGMMSRQISEKTDAWDDPMGNLCIEELIAKYPADFQDVLIYESMEALNSEIEMLNDMPYYELRDWTINHNFTNITIESNIVYDSLLTAYMEYYGETEEDEDYPNEEYMELLIEEIMTEYRHLFPYVENELQFEPFDISIYAMLNDNGLLVIGSDVYMIVDDWQGLVIMSYADYPIVREQPRYMCVLASLGGLSGELGYKPIPEILLSNTITNGKYSLKYTYSVEYTQHRFYGTSDIVVSLLVKNYKKIGCTNCIIKRKISLDTEFSVYFIPSSIEQLGQTENYHFGPCETVKRVFKYDFRHHYYYATIVPYYGSQTTVYSLHVSNEEVFVDL